MSKTRISVLHNLPAPYRLAIFEKLLNDQELEVRIFFTGTPRSNRPSWSSDFHSDDRRIEYLPEVAIPLRGKSADKIHFNSSIGKVFSSNPDVILIDGYQDPTNLLVAVLCWRKKIPYILSAEISYVWTSTFTGKLFNRFMAPVVRRASYLTPSSRSCESFFLRLGGDGSRMRIIPPLPDVHLRASICSERRKNSRQIRARYGLTDKFVVAYIGRFEDYKGIRELLTAMSDVITQDPGVAFVFVGKGSIENEVERECRLHPSNSLCLGSVNDDTLYDIYSVADVHVMPSWHEAYGIVSAEALACGVPSIVTSTSGASDLITNGVNGYLIDPRDPSAISRSILSLRAAPVLLAQMKIFASSSLAPMSIDNLYASLKESIEVAKKKGHV